MEVRDFLKQPAVYAASGLFALTAVLQLVNGLFFGQIDTSPNIAPAIACLLVAASLFLLTRRPKLGVSILRAALIVLLVLLAMLVMLFVMTFINTPVGGLEQMLSASVGVAMIPGIPGMGVQFALAMLVFVLLVVALFVWNAIKLLGSFRDIFDNTANAPTHGKKMAVASGLVALLAISSVLLGAANGQTAPMDIASSLSSAAAFVALAVFGWSCRIPSDKKKKQTKHL